MAKAAKKALSKKTKTVKKTGAAAKRMAPGSSPASKKGTLGFTARTAKEITATFRDSIGLTAKVAAAVAAARVNILAATGYSASGMRKNATFNLVVDDFVKAEKALDRIGAEDIHESSIIMVETPNKVGALQRVAKIIADADIDIYYFYATTSSGKTATSVIKTANDKKAIKALQEA
ncbi:MAG: hypothetical protein A2X58_11530 [Nitrospirae bacterium GWC2_56_14]|nr:MAG: hypothetical protein A2X58_11530 [Nitrospirae bacterium GWC2_56_14]